MATESNYWEYLNAFQLQPLDFYNSYLKKLSELTDFCSERHNKLQKSLGSKVIQDNIYLQNIG